MIAVVALARRMAGILYAMMRDAMLREGVAYQDLGPDHFDRRDKDKMVRRLVLRLETLGCKVQVTAAA
jgi:hypothetical protein